MKTLTKKRSAKFVSFVNSEGLRVSFPETVTIAELTKAGIKLDLVDKGTKPTVTHFIGPA